MNATKRNLNWIKNKKYLGAFLADTFFIEMISSCQYRKELAGVHYPKRPEKYHSFINRIFQARDVLFGKADALYWIEDIEENI